MGNGVELPAATRLGRIVTLVPTPTSTFRLSKQTKTTLMRLAQERDRSMSEILELAVAHFAGTLAAGQPIYFPEPPAAAARHKKAAGGG